MTTQASSTCERVELDLVGYQFGALDDETRRVVEEHLVGCPRCVRALVETKRAIEAPVLEEAPAKARARLRRAVAQELGIAMAPRRVWERPIAFAIAASVVLAASAATKALTAPASPPVGISAVVMEGPK